MDILVEGGQVLSGEIVPSGSKNSAVALIPASLLFDNEITLENIPNIVDVEKYISILKLFGSKISWDKDQKTLKIDNGNISLRDVDKESLGTMRGSSLLWGPLLARFRQFEFGRRPGGCNLGFRTLSAHYAAFSDLGVDVAESVFGIKMNVNAAKGKEIWLTEMSPTATENVVMLATQLKGVTKIYNAASEPQVQDLCNFLVNSGAKIQGIGSNLITVEGGLELFPKSYALLPDHYEIATFLALGAVTGGKVKVRNAMPDMFVHIRKVFSKFGINIFYEGDTAVVESNQKVTIKPDEANHILTIKAHPWPGLPVDILPLFIPMALAAKSGQVLFHNWMYDAGLFWSSELTKLGANIVMSDPHRVVVVSGNKLRGAIMDAPYIIRSVVAMIMAAMVASGESTIRNADALYRGHPHFSENLKKLGAKVREVK